MNINDIVNQGEEQKKAVEKSQTRHRVGGYIVGVVLGSVMALVVSTPARAPAEVHKGKQGGIVVKNGWGDEYTMPFPEELTEVRYVHVEHGKPQRVEIYAWNKGSQREWRQATVIADNSKTVLVEHEPNIFYNDVNP